MKWNDIGSFLDAIEDRMNELESEGLADINSSTNVSNDSHFADDELEKFDSIKDEATSLCEGDDVLEYMCNRLSDLGYSDDEITQILDYEGM